MVGLIWIQMLRTSLTNTHYITTYPSSVHYCVIYLEIKPSKARSFWFSIQSGPYCFGERETHMPLPGSNEAVDQVKVQAIETDRERDGLHG